MYADLSDAYMFIDCKMKESENAIVVAEAFPKSVESVYENSVVGKIVFDTFEPGVFYSYRQGKKSLIRQAVTQEGKSVEQSVVPIKNDLHQVIGVLIQEKEVAYPVSYQSDRQKDSVSQESIDYVMGDKNSDMPMVSDLLMEMFLLTDNENKLHSTISPLILEYLTPFKKYKKALKDRSL